MEDEKRSHKRIKPDGLSAHIMIAPPAPGEKIIIDGVVVDLSYSGIKIKLERALEESIDQCELRISIRLPESGVPMSIHGMIRHLSDNGECGLQYVDKHDEQSLDDLMFECVKYVPHDSDD